MARLQLHFVSSSRGHELDRTLFEHPLSQRCVRSTRGKTQGAFSSSGTFQWTPAVRALCILLLRTKAASLENNSDRRPILQTMSKGAVSAFDYAISRRAAWISDMFGTDSHGAPLARRLFKRSNPERKRPGPLAIALNERFLPCASIEILVDSKHEDSAVKLEAIAAALLETGNWELCVVSGGRESKSESISQAPSLRELRPGFVRELQSMLRATNIFSTRAVRAALSEIERTPSLGVVKNDIFSELESLDLRLLASDRLGLSLTPSELDVLFPEGRPLRFGVTPSQIGSIALLRFLKEVKKLPVEIDYSFAHTSDLAKRVEAGGGKDCPDCCVMTTASYAMLNCARRREFRPLMIMPAATHSIMGSRSTGAHDSLLAGAEYLFLSEFPTTPGFWFDALRNSGAIQKENSPSIHTEPDEALSALRSNDPRIRTILWFPYNIIASSMTGAVSLLDSPAPGVGLGFIQNMLFVHQSHAKNIAWRRLLDTLIRDAWLHLLEDSELCSILLTRQLEEEEYCRKLWRYSGLYRFEQQFAA